MSEPTRDRKPTMLDVARLAGVSHQTVSRFLRHNGGLKEATQSRIETAITELDYRPNLVARSMRTQRSGLLAILIPAQMDATSPGQVAASATTEAHEAGYRVEVISVEGGSEARGQRMLELADSGLVEGILSLAPIPASVRERLRPDGAAVVVSDNYDDKMRVIGPLADASLIGEMIDYLAGMGHRRFLHVAGPAEHPSAQERKRAYLAAVDRLDLESTGVHEGDWSARSGMDAVAMLPESGGATAIICANDVVAAGAARAALDRGWTIPDNLSITGWDNNPLSGLLSPRLTSVDVDYTMLGRTSIRKLIAAVRRVGVAEPATPQPLQRIIWRESVGPLTAD